MAWCVGQALRARQGVKKRKPEKKNVVSVRTRIRRLVFFVFFCFGCFQGVKGWLAVHAPMKQHARGRRLEEKRG